MTAAAKLEDATEFRVDVTIFTKSSDLRKTSEKNYKSEIFASLEEAENFIESLPAKANYSLQFRTPQLKIFKMAYETRIKAGA